MHACHLICLVTPGLIRIRRSGHNFLPSNIQVHVTYIVVELVHDIFRCSSGELPSYIRSTCSLPAHLVDDTALPPPRERPSTSSYRRLHHSRLLWNHAAFPYLSCRELSSCLRWATKSLPSVDKVFLNESLVGATCQVLSVHVNARML